MTSPSAQKAAGEIATRAIGRIQSECIGTQTGALAWKEAASIIQQAITEAVDAAVAAKEKRVKELEAALNKLEAAMTSDADGWDAEADYKRAAVIQKWRNELRKIIANPNDPSLEYNLPTKASAALEAPHEPSL